MQDTTGRRPRRLGPIRRLAALATAATVLGIAAAPAAADPTGDYAQFNHCPLGAPNLAACFYSETTSGSFTLGNETVPINKTIVLQGGVAQDPDTLETTFVNASGADTLSKTKLRVPGGLTGIMSPETFPGPLSALFWSAVNSVNDVYATAELVGPVGYDLINYISGTGPALTLPVRIRLENPFLGSSCYVGSASNPVTLRLTTGTTSPPPPNTPITGDTGAVEFLNDGDLLVANGFRLVDNAFSVPGASGCGPLLFRPLVNAAVNLTSGFPSPAGENTAILQGSFKQANPNAVIASEG